MYKQELTSVDNINPLTSVLEETWLLAISGIFLDTLPEMCSLSIFNSFSSFCPLAYHNALTLSDILPFLCQLRYSFLSNYRKSACSLLECSGSSSPCTSVKWCHISGMMPILDGNSSPANEALHSGNAWKMLTTTKCLQKFIKGVFMFPKKRKCNKWYTPIPAVLF